MNPPAQAQIYLADQRGCSEADFLRSYHCFNFGSYSEESRKPFGPLQLLNDDALRAGALLMMQVESNTSVLLIPVVGGLEYESDGATGSPAPGFLEPGQVQLLSLVAGMNYVVRNPYETESINFLQVWLTSPASTFSPGFSQTAFDLTQRNTLLPLFSLVGKQVAGYPGSRGYIGQYDGRQEGIYYVPKSAERPPGIFVFVLQGVFEVQNRLLHEKDGLALLPVQNDAVEFEALSNDAILILMELLA